MMCVRQWLIVGSLTLAAVNSRRWPGSRSSLVILILILSSERVGEASDGGDGSGVLSAWGGELWRVCCID
eukprot:scaffold4049_cov63-Cyclotella_meneghiniana.AAC.1